MNEESIADRLYRAAFERPRTRRSEEYRRGVMDTLRFRLGVEGDLKCPYTIGSASADAWFAGSTEGMHIARHYERGDAS